MQLLLGETARSVYTSLGKIVYDTADPVLQLPDGDNFLPDMVFLHGFGGGSSAYEWSKIYPAFTSEYCVLAPDLIGWGRSDHPARDYTVVDYLTMIREFLEATCNQAAIVVASSLTAALTIRVAIAHPHLFRALILTAPAGLSDFGNNYTRSAFAQLVSTPTLGRLLYNTGIATELGIRSFLRQRQFAQSNRVSQEIVEAYLLSALQPNAEYSALSFVRGDLCFDLAQHIAQLTVPTAMIWGQRSQFTPPEIGYRLAAMNPQAVRFLEVVDDVGLTPQLELPALTVGLIRKFLKGL